MFRLAEPIKRVPLEDQAAEIVKRAEALGVEAWTFAAPGSKVYVNQISDLYGSNQEEMDAIKQAVDEYEEGGDGTIGMEGTVSRHWPGGNLKLDYKKFAKDQISHELVKRVSDFGSYLEPFGDIAMRIHRYDRKRAGAIKFVVRTEDGSHQEDHPLGWWCHPSPLSTRSERRKASQK